jgi:hypothetical protein
MADLWEPVNGVFRSTPPEPPVEGVSVYWFIFSALVVAIVGAVVVWRSAKKDKPLKWSLRNHLGKVGSAITYTYLVVIVAMIWGRSGQLLTMPLNEVGDFLAGAFGPVAFLWLVLGFLQQGDELRMSTKALELQGDELKLSTIALRDQAAELKKSVEHQATMAEVAIKQMEAQHAELQMQVDAHDKSLRADFAMHTISLGNEPRGMAMNKIRIVNQGATAADLAITFEPPILDIHVPELGVMRGGEVRDHKVVFNPSTPVGEGECTITYVDTEGTIRHQTFVYTLDRSLSKLVFKKVHGGAA